MGLLDILGTSWEDPKTMAALQLASGLLGGQGNTMQRLAGGLNAYGATLGAAKKAQQDEEERRAIMAQRAAQEQRAQQQFVMQQQLGGLQLNQAARADAETVAQAAREDAFRGSIPSPQGQALRSLGADASPTMTNAARMPQVDPRSQFLFDALQARQLKPMDYLTATAKDTTPIKLGANERLLEPKTNRVLVDAVPDPAKMSPVAQLMAEMNTLPPGDPRRAIYQNAIAKATTHQPGTTVTVQPDNLGLKPKDRFEMEQKLAADYTTATKTDRGIVSVSSDLTNILKQPGAIKDQAAIYKFAKFLDPEGAVREADYAAIVKTAGGLDYVKNLVNRAMTGEQLGPKQRAEMDSLVRSMATVAQKRIDGAKKRFSGNAKMYNLDPDNVFQMGDDQVPSLQDLAAAELARRQGGR